MGHSRGPTYRPQRSGSLATTKFSLHVLQSTGPTEIPREMKLATKRDQLDILHIKFDIHTNWIKVQNRKSKIALMQAI